MRKWAIVDLDGTLFNIDHRHHIAVAAQAARFTVEREKLWDDFHRACVGDTLVDGVADLVRAWAETGGGIVYLTGRSDIMREPTRAMIAGASLPTEDAPLLMRPAPSRAGSIEFKSRMYTDIIRPKIMGPTDRVAFVLEDSNKLVAMWRETFGLTTLQPRISEY